MMSHVFATAAEAEKASNEMYLFKNPEGTTERLYGWIEVEGGFILSGMDESWKLVDGKWVIT